MTTHQIFVKNIQCGDSMNSLKYNLLKTNGITAVDFFEEENRVCITSKTLGRDEIVTALASLGYSEKENSGIFTKKNSFEHWYCYSCSGCDS